jgi:hypothetical protein
MRRRSYFFAAGILACLICGVVGVLIVMVRHEPNWYTNAAVPPGSERTQQALECYGLGSEMWTMILNDREWGGKFQARQLNAYIQDGQLEQFFGTDLLPANVSEPRLAFEPDRIRFGFRYGKGIWSTIVSMTFKAWVAQDESSAVVLELESFEAGVLPVSAQSVLDEISRALRQKDVEINWYRHDGHPVAVVRFPGKQQGTTIQLTAIQVKDGQLVVQGRNNDPTLGPFGPGAAPVAAGTDQQ